MKNNLNKSSESNQVKWKTQEIEVIKKFIKYIIIIGVVVGSTAPFYHIFLPKTAKEKIELEKKYEQGKLTEKDYQLKKFALKNKYKFAGFTNKRRFMYAIGLPVSLLSCSLLFLTSSFYISEKKTKTAFRIASFPFLIVSIYFILWTCWAYKTSHDFPVQAYYTILIVSSLLIGLSLDKIITVIHSNQHKIKDLILLTFRIRDKHYIDIAVKAKYAEQYNKALSDTKTVKQHADELDKDIDKTFNQLL